MARTVHPQIVTANHLLSGDVVYWTANGSWSGDISNAIIAENAEEANSLLTQAASQTSIIVGAYLMDVAKDDAGQPQPIHFREAFRTRGPSNYFHGKQAEV